MNVRWWAVGIGVLSALALGLYFSYETPYTPGRCHLVVSDEEFNECFPTWATATAEATK